MAPYPMARCFRCHPVSDFLDFDNLQVLTLAMLGGQRRYEVFGGQFVVCHQDADRVNTGRSRFPHVAIRRISEEAQIMDQITRCIK